MESNLNITTTGSFGLGCLIPNAFLNIKSSNVIYSDSDDFFLVRVLLPGVAKKDITIEVVKEKDFITVEIDILSDLDWIPRCVKVTKVIKDINLDKKIKVEMSNGLLLLKFPKKYPIKREELKF